MSLLELIDGAFGASFLLHYWEMKGRQQGHIYKTTFTQHVKIYTPAKELCGCVNCRTLLIALLTNNMMHVI